MFSPTGDISYRGRWIPLDEWQEMMRQEKVRDNERRAEREAIRERILEVATVIACALAFLWIVLPGLWNIWRG